MSAGPPQACPGLRKGRPVRQQAPGLGAAAGMHARACAQGALGCPTPGASLCGAPLSRARRACAARAGPVRRATRAEAAGARRRSWPGAARSTTSATSTQPSRCSSQAPASCAPRSRPALARCAALRECAAQQERLGAMQVANGLGVMHRPGNLPAAKECLSLPESGRG